MPKNLFISNPLGSIFEKEIKRQTRKCCNCVILYTFHLRNLVNGMRYFPIYLTLVFNSCKSKKPCKTTSKNTPNWCCYIPRKQWLVQWSTCGYLISENIWLSGQSLSEKATWTQAEMFSYPLGVAVFHSSFRTFEIITTWIFSSTHE